MNELNRIKIWSLREYDCFTLSNFLQKQVFFRTFILLGNYENVKLTGIWLIVLLFQTSYKNKFFFILSYAWATMLCRVEIWQTIVFVEHSKNHQYKILQEYRYAKGLLAFGQKYIYVRIWTKIWLFVYVFSKYSVINQLSHKFFSAYWHSSCFAHKNPVFGTVLHSWQNS